ncbi:MAG: hypothetical protein ACRDHS_07620 [Actinomycetota bacterium]
MEGSGAGVVAAAVAVAAVPPVRVERAVPPVRVERAVPPVRVEPAVPRVRVERAVPPVREEPAVPQVNLPAWMAPAVGAPEPVRLARATPAVRPLRSDAGCDEGPAAAGPSYRFGFGSAQPTSRTFVAWGPF